MKKIVGLLLVVMSTSVMANTLMSDVPNLESADFVFGSNPPTSPQAVVPQSSSTFNQTISSPIVNNNVSTTDNDILNSIEKIKTEFCVMSKQDCIDVDFEYYQNIVMQSHLSFIERGEFVLIGDKSPTKQKMHVFIVYSGVPYYIGSAKISTGEKGLYDHYYTPVGIYENKTDILNYRALGTKNSKGIRGNGFKGARVYDFGWVEANKGWKHKLPTTPIRFQMHATDADYLEKSLGRPNSKGCIRLSNWFNRFIDEYGVLDYHYEQNKESSRAIKYTISPKKIETGFDGRYMIIVGDDGIV